MIPRPYIDAWRIIAPWQKIEMVEQDLIISRAIIDIFNDTFLGQHVAFRGGTALHKLCLQPQTRYSEDIDLVQMNAEPIGETIDRFRTILSYLGEPDYEQKHRNTILVYRFDSETPPVVRLRVKIEINCREHFTVFGYQKTPYRVESRWFTGQGNLVTYSIEELLGSKMRALFQRKKGRDLFDLWYSFKQLTIDADKVLKAFDAFLKHDQLTISKDEYLDNVDAKLSDPDFRNDLAGLIRPGIKFDFDKSWDFLKEKIIFKMNPKIGV